MNRTNLWIIIEIAEELKRLKTSKKYFSKKTDFTRDRVFTFETVFHLIADLPRLSLSIEIEKGLKEINKIIGKREEGTKGGFCKARNKILPKLFKVINEKLLALFYSLSGQVIPKRWKGFIIRGIDGSIIDIVDTAENRLEFGTQKNQYGLVVQARMMIGYDVMNKVITHSHLGNLSIGEGNVVKKWISEMKTDELNIYDRLFPGVSFQYLHHYYNTPYVIRCKLGHNKQVADFVKSKKKERTETWKLNNTAITELKEMGLEVNKETTIRVRLIRVELDNGEVEVLLTSLVDNKKYPHKIFKGLYFKRWGVEIVNGFLKNTLQIEITSGRKVNTIYQDFYATIFRANIQALIELDCEPKLQAINKRRKNNYAINRTAAAGNLKRKLPQLILGNAPQIVYEKLINVFIKNIEPVRPDRMFPRIKRAQKLSGKYKPLKNYKRAI